MPTGETFRKTSIRKVGINISSTWKYAQAYMSSLLQWYARIKSLKSTDLENLSLYWMVLLKCSRSECGVFSCRSVWRSVTGCCEHGNELSVLARKWQFVDYLYFFVFWMGSSRCVLSNIHYSSTVNTQHMQRPDVLLQVGYTWRHFSAVKRPSSGQLRIILLRYSQNCCPIGSHCLHDIGQQFWLYLNNIILSWPEDGRLTAETCRQV